MAILHLNYVYHKPTYCIICSYTGILLTFMLPHPISTFYHIIHIPIIHILHINILYIIQLYISIYYYLHMYKFHTCIYRAFIDNIY